MNNGTLLVCSLLVVMVVLACVAPLWCEWLALGLMICAGIPHGSFDLRVAEAKWRDGRVSRGMLLTGYLSCVFGMGGLCVFVPAVGFALFLVISAIHFSEGEAHASAPPDTTRGFLFGVGSIILPIGLHVHEAQPYMSYFLSEEVFAWTQASLRILSVMLAFIVAGMSTQDLIWGAGDKKSDAIERLACLCGWIVLPPLAGFAVWFIGRHSRQHLEVCKGMFSTDRVVIPADFVVISLLAIGGLTPFALLFDFSDIHQLFAASLCLIAGLTLPHMVVSHGMRELSIFIFICTGAPATS